MGERTGRPSRTAVVLNFAAIYLIWGSTYLAIRFAVESLPPFLMGGLRFLVAGGLMYAWARARGAVRPTRAHWSATLVVGGFLLLGGNGGVAWAEQRVPSALAALLVATVPLWMVLLEWGGGGARPTGRVVVGLAIGFAGLAVLIGPSELLGAGAADLLGAGVLTAAALSWAIGSIVSRRVSLPESAVLATAMQMLGGGALLLLAGTLAGEWGGLDPAAVSPRSWAAVLYLIVFGSFIGFSAYAWLLRHVEVAKVSTYAYVNPIVAVVLGWAVAGEPMTPRMLLAAAVIVAGVAFITAGRRGPAMERAETAPADAALHGRGAPPRRRALG